jgi:hypothetical protein
MGNDTTERKRTSGTDPRALCVDGVPFSWWVVGERPAVVTVRVPLLGSLTASTEGDPAELALALAKRLLAEDDGGAAAAPRRHRSPAALDALQKPGWFEAGDLDFTSTVF